jgi:hypothetical protein
MAGAIGRKIEELIEALSRRAATRTWCCLGRAWVQGAGFAMLRAAGGVWLCSIKSSQATGKKL